MMQSSREFLEQQIPMKQALSAVLIAEFGLALATAYALSLEKRLARVTAKANQDGAMYRDTIHVMLKHATPAAIQELQEKIDYWAIVQGSINPL